MKRVVVTGIGAVTPAGLTATDSWQAVIGGRSAIGPIEGIPRERLTVGIAAQVRDFDATQHFPSKKLSQLDRVSQFAVVAARQAVADSALAFTDDLAEQVAVIIGIGVGGMVTIDDSFHQLYAENAKRCHPFTIPRLMPNAPASQVSMDLGLKGTTFAVASACASGTHAIGLAFRAVRAGETPVALAGGSEACVTVGSLMAWEALRVLSADSCRPFSKGRSGLVIGEGSAMLLLEELEHARARGATIYAEIAGFGANADAGDLTSPDTENAARAMRLALADARLEPAEIGYINAHGTGTAMNDLVESAAIKQIFGIERTPPLSSIKGALGHSLGAAGAIEAMVTALALRDAILPPTANFLEADPAIALDVIPNQARPAAIEAAISNSFAFGGLNAVLALRRIAPG